ncbi:type I-E CRISPR-associated protein Cas5/CasD [Streptomyces gilvosporeus]|uniref:Type I-E CRISPR-associated protein Cas5/CasD n=1 Tax=Streptomyces gilvosporeus TaxID=553510 RepID=A0A1V0TZG4_9ACTN|nr:type I-E CRISPR-associated protein Cas5/CasD [Streptomyces gilvosporeus]ARF58334.1 type I-E CRISPR-associated protein Cas5/CasD [Streptomyces gilvosporeus]
MTPATPSKTVPEPGLLLRLAGPLQSWGEHSHFNERDTAACPTRSGVIGLLAAALGRRRGTPLEDLARLSLTVRVDRPGVLLRDLHTVGGGLPSKATVTTAEGKKRSGDTGTLLTHRAYLADAAFTLALTGGPDDKDLLVRLAAALDSPRWPLFLGRRSCPPEGPLLLGTAEHALHHLVHLPLATDQKGSMDTGVGFLSDRPLDRLPVPEGAANEGEENGKHPSGKVNDEPVSFHPRHRSYRTRALYRRTLHLPDVHRALGIDHLEALGAYACEHLNRPEGSRR